jgi:hypothetical protein
MNTSISLQYAMPIAIRGGCAVLRLEPHLPRPHDPDDRVLVATIGPWELRDFAEGSSFARFFAKHGIAHRQLYARAVGLSILTPSPLTEGEFDLRSIDGERWATRSERALREHVSERYGAALPDGVALRALARWIPR